MTTQRKFWNNFLFSALLLVSTIFIGCANSEGETSSSSKNAKLTIVHGDLNFEMDDNMQTRIFSSSEGAKSFMNNYQASEIIELKDENADLFKVDNIEENTVKQGELNGKQWIITGVYNKNNKKIKKVLTIKAFDNFPDMLSVKSSYQNLSDNDLYIRNWKNHNYSILSQGDAPNFWAFQGSSSFERKDWILPLEPGYFNRNYMGMNNTDYGGGIPVTSIWRKDAGIAVGHLENKPKLISLPTEMGLEKTDAKISVSKSFKYPTVFAKESTVETVETFVMVHKGDYYNALSEYSKYMQKNGIKMAKSEDAAYETIWCSWGYEDGFTLKEIEETLPKIKELGIKWVVLDYGFQKIEGDWFANKEKFPRGNIEIKELVDKIHSKDLKAKIWWTPLAASPKSQALAKAPEMRLHNIDWSPQFITFFDIYYLSPKNEIAEKHTKETLDLFIKEWGFDGLKMDGMHMNAVPPDHNPASKLEYPEQAVEELPNFFQMIYDYTTAMKPNAVIENCPCGACMSYFNMASMNQSVSSDPTSSWQIRHRGKTYKALIPQTAYYGDHVELSDGNDDFASTFGIGGVIGTKFTWPKDNPRATRLEHENLLLTPEKEKLYKKWFNMYDDMMISKGKYIGDLYDIGYDKPEAHLIEKENTLYYAFYADEWNKPVTLKGLKEGVKYSVVDYVNDVDYGEVTSTNPSIDVKFKKYLLLKVKPLK